MAQEASHVKPGIQESRNPVIQKSKIHNPKHGAIKSEHIQDLSLALDRRGQISDFRFQIPWLRHLGP